MKRKHLGKGLEALIPQISPEDEQSRGESLFTVEVARVRANPSQPRVEFDPQGLDELKQSITENGVIQPITVRKTDDGFELIAGERRLRAVQELGFPTIPAYVMDVTSEDQMLELALVENIQREDLNPMELARAYDRLQKEYGLTQEAVARKVSKDRATVANFIRLLKLPAVIQESLRKGEITMGHARALMGLQSQGEQTRIWRRIIKQGWNVRKVEDLVRESTEPGKSEKKSSVKSPFLVEIEDRLRSVLGTQVRIRSRNTASGQIEITYYSNEDLERIIDVLTEKSGR